MDIFGALVAEIACAAVFRPQERKPPMPVIRKAAEHPATPGDTAAVTPLLGRDDIGNDQCVVSRVTVPAGQRLDAGTAGDELAWFQVLRGAGRLGDTPVDTRSVAFLRPGTRTVIGADSPLDLLWTVVPRASRFDPDLAATDPGVTVIDWTHEPVLQSEHDARTRIYVATPALLGTGAIKAEIITYPPGTSAPEHHHEGAEHFQYVLSGTGTAVLDGAHQTLAPGDILYNYENERHWFFTPPDAETDFVFVEFFIPGHCRTVWTESASACAWLPTGRDLKGGAPSREIGYHVHGEGTGI
jgi:quercetin dioxygenase-like cupin family protein